MVVTGTVVVLAMGDDVVAALVTSDVGTESPSGDDVSTVHTGGKGVRVASFGKSFSHGYRGPTD